MSGRPLLELSWKPQDKSLPVRKVTDLLNEDLCQVQHDMYASERLCVHEYADASCPKGRVSLPLAVPLCLSLEVLRCVLSVCRFWCLMVFSSVLVLDLSQKNWKHSGINRWLSCEPAATSSLRLQRVSGLRLN